MRAAVIEVSFDLLADWLHLPPGVTVDAVAPGTDFRSFHVRMRSASDFLPDVPDCGAFPVGTLTITAPAPTVEFRAY